MKNQARKKLSGMPANKAQTMKYGLLRYKIQRAMTPITDEWIHQVTEQIQWINQELESASHQARQAVTGSPQEDACLDRIRALEDERFRLLGELHGNDIQGYRELPAHYPQQA